MTSVLSTAWLAWKLWQSCTVSQAPSVQPAFICFFLSDQPALFYSLEWYGKKSEGPGFNLGSIYPGGFFVAKKINKAWEWHLRIDLFIHCKDIFSV